MERDAEGAACPCEQAVGVAEWKWGKRKRRAARRDPRVVRSARDAQRLLGTRVVRLQVLVRDRPVIGDAVEGPKPEVVGVKPQSISLPVECASADTPNALPVEYVWGRTPWR